MFSGFLNKLDVAVTSPFIRAALGTLHGIRSDMDRCQKMTVPHSTSVAIKGSAILTMPKAIKGNYVNCCVSSSSFFPSTV